MTTLKIKDHEAYANADAWMKWEGGEMPVSDETEVVIKTGYGETNGSACEFRWSKEGLKGDISSYRIRKADERYYPYSEYPSTAKAMNKTAPDLLKAAAQHMADRAKTYDKPDGERSMGNAVRAFNIITGKDLSEAEGWLLLQILKDVRQWQNSAYHADSAEDCIAYAALKAEALQCQS